MDVNMSLYELNRSIVTQQGPMDDDTLNDILREVTNFLWSTENEFFMLYGKEINYFTIFRKGWKYEDSFSTAFKDTLSNVGTIYSISLTEQKDAYEIWVKTQDDLVTCMYLFPYDSGIVTFREDL